MNVLTPYTRGQVLYDNLFRRAYFVEYDEAEIDGYGFIAAYDLMDSSIFLTTASGSPSLYFSVPPGSVFDTFAMMVVPFDLSDLPDELIIGYGLIGAGIIGLSNGSCTVTVHVETGPGTNTWIEVASHEFTGKDSMWYVNLPASYAIDTTERIRVSFDNTGGSQLAVREMSIGRRLTFTTGQHAGVAPPSFVSDMVITNSVSINGSVLGRQTRSVEKSAEIKLENMTRAWMDQYWAPFSVHAAKVGPFFYCWDYTNHPEDACFVTAANVSAPVNSNRVPLMDVSMPLRVIS